MDPNKVNPEETILVLKYLNRGRPVRNSKLKAMGIDHPYSHIRKLILSGHTIKSSGVGINGCADWEYILTK